MPLGPCLGAGVAGLAFVGEVVLVSAPFVLEEPNREFSFAFFDDSALMSWSSALRLVEANDEKNLSLGCDPVGAATVLGASCVAGLLATGCGVLKPPKPPKPPAAKRPPEGLGAGVTVCAGCSADVLGAVVVCDCLLADVIIVCPAEPSPSLM